MLLGQYHVGGVEASLSGQRENEHFAMKNGLEIARMKSSLEISSMKRSLEISSRLIGEKTSFKVASFYHVRSLPLA